MLKRLSDEQVQEYTAKGIVFPIPVLSSDEVSHFRSQFEEFETRLGGTPKMVELGQTHLHFRWANDLSTHPAVLDAVEDVLGPDILIWTTSIFPKHPHDPSFISWHQDGTYWALDSTDVATAWIALTDSTVQNGCMRVVPDSHKEPIRPHCDTYAEDNLLSRGQEIEVEVDETEAVDVVLRAGEMSLHHVNIIHGSNANPSDSKRIGFAIRFITPRVDQLAEKPLVILARGVDEYHHFSVLASPPAASIEEGLAAQMESTRQRIVRRRAIRRA